MQRAVLELTHSEIEVLLKNLNLETYQGLPLYSKLTSIVLDSNNPQNHKILLSEEEMEKILDELGFVPESVNPLLFSAISKINQLISSTRV